MTKQTEQIIEAYRTAKNTRDLVDKLKAILDMAHEAATVKSLEDSLDELKDHVGDDHGALALAVQTADAIGTRPDWLAEASWRWSKESLAGKKGGKGRHARAQVRAEDIALAKETLVTYRLIKLANKTIAKRGQFA